ncbi:hypothetical protein NL314_27695, partial [Klebsiella pneumoniae]|nr:hypothetical protein [Klebsiella pneumoniae]
LTLGHLWLNRFAHLASRLQRLSGVAPDSSTAVKPQLVDEGRASMDGSNGVLRTPTQLKRAFTFNRQITQQQQVQNWNGQAPKEQRSTRLVFI